MLNMEVPLFMRGQLNILETVVKSTRLQLTPPDNQRLQSLCGQYNRHVQLLEQYFSVQINHRGYTFYIKGEAQKVDIAKKMLRVIYQQTEEDKFLTPEKIFRILRNSDKELQSSSKLSRSRGKTMMQETEDHSSAIRTKRATIKACSPNQERYLKNIAHHDINFAIGPAGTGKTFLAVAAAVAALEREQIQRIILVRPAVEAGEKLGFLPGDLAEKVNPYLRPLYDALYEMMGVEKVVKLLENDVIEIAPIAYMRGRTLNDAFIIMDEGQNTTPEQMKMFLTRVGFGSKVIVTGDVTQIDLPKHVNSGLMHAMNVLKNVKGISFTFFEAKDAVRHPLVQYIIEAYEAVSHKNNDLNDD